MDRVPRIATDPALAGAEGGSEDQGGTIAAFIRRFRSEAPTSPEQRRQQRATAGRNEFWWQRQPEASASAASEDSHKPFTTHSRQENGRTAETALSLFELDAAREDTPGSSLLVEGMRNSDSLSKGSDGESDRWLEALRP